MSKKIKEPSIDQMNAVIAFYMGAKKSQFKFPTGLKVPVLVIPKYGSFIFGKERDNSKMRYDLLFHKRYDWIMPVAEKLALRTKVMTIHKNSCALKGSLPYYHGKTTVEAIHKAVYYTIVSESLEKIVSKKMSNKEWISEMEKITPITNK